jgi:putative flippase GtrA
MTSRARWIRFGVVGLAGVVVQLATLATLVQCLDADTAVATVVAVAAALVHNFLWHSVWTWNDRRGLEPLVPAFRRFVAANGAISIAGNLIVTSALVGLGGMADVQANAIAIATCAVANFYLADLVVFRRAPPPVG